ncbi:hypothetical protein HK405_008528, partial [Cladochytrium tenue]
MGGVGDDPRRRSRRALPITPLASAYATAAATTAALAGSDGSAAAAAPSPSSSPPSSPSIASATASVSSFVSGSTPPSLQPLMRPPAVATSTPSPPPLVGVAGSFNAAPLSSGSLAPPLAPPALVPTVQPASSSQTSDSPRSSIEVSPQRDHRMDTRPFVPAEKPSVSRAVKLERRLSPLNPYSSLQSYQQAPTSVPSPKIAAGVAMAVSSSSASAASAAVSSSSFGSSGSSSASLSLFGAFPAGSEDTSGADLGPLTAPAARPGPEHSVEGALPPVQTKRRTLTSVAPVVKMLNRSFSDADAVVSGDPHGPSFLMTPPNAAKAIAATAFGAHRRLSKTSMASMTDSEVDSVANPATSPTSQSPPLHSSTIRVVRPRRSSLFDSSLLPNQPQGQGVASSPPQALALPASARPRTEHGVDAHSLAN